MTTDTTYNTLFICTGNSARSILAEGLLNELGKGRFHAYPVTAQWGVPDPAAVAGTDEQQRKAFLDAAITLRRRIQLLLSLPLQRLDAISLQRELRHIGRQ